MFAILGRYLGTKVQDFGNIGQLNRIWLRLQFFHQTCSMQGGFRNPTPEALNQLIPKS